MSGVTEGANQEQEEIMGIPAYLKVVVLREATLHATGADEAQIYHMTEKHTKDTVLLRIYNNFFRVKYENQSNGCAVGEEAVILRYVMLRFVLWWGLL